MNKTQEDDDQGVLSDAMSEGGSVVDPRYYAEGVPALPFFYRSNSSSPT